MNNILQFLEENIEINKTDLQVYNNAAFDGDDSSDCTKENLNPTTLNNSSSSFSKPSKQVKFENQRNIDDEIAEIESEIRRLNSRLEALRLEKAERKIASEKRVGRIVPAKFLEPKRNAVVSFADDNNGLKRNGVVFNTPKRNGVVSKDDTPRKVNCRRGMSLGPAEIAGKVPPVTTPVTVNRRKSLGTSLGPAEIASKIPAATTPAMQNRGKSQGMMLGPAEIASKIPAATTPATQNRQKSRGKSLCPAEIVGMLPAATTPAMQNRKNPRGMSLGPAEIASKIPAATTPATQNRRKTICKANTIGAIKSMEKKDEEMIQPRNLFNEGEIEKLGGVSSNKKGCMKQGRVVASRYNSGAVDVRKRSFPENNKGGNEVRVKKRWEIPIEDVDVSGFVMLPKISTLKCVDDESPRDSGAAKRVAELNGKKSFFCTDNDEEEGFGCQILSFDDEDNDCEQG